VSDRGLPSRDRGIRIRVRDVAVSRRPRHRYATSLGPSHPSVWTAIEASRWTRSPANGDNHTAAKCVWSASCQASQLCYYQHECSTTNSRYTTPWRWHWYYVYVIPGRRRTLRFDWDNYVVCVGILTDWSIGLLLHIWWFYLFMIHICDKMSYFGEILSGWHYIRVICCSFTRTVFPLVPPCFQVLKIWQSRCNCVVNIIYYLRYV